MNQNKHSELNETDLKFLKRCLELAQEAFEAGDEPLVRYWSAATAG